MHRGVHVDALAGRDRRGPARGALARRSGDDDRRARRRRTAPTSLLLAPLRAPRLRRGHHDGAAVRPLAHAGGARAGRTHARPAQRRGVARPWWPRRGRVPCPRRGRGVRLSEAEEIARRKAEHLRLAAEADVETRTPAGWDDVQIVHDALPDVDAADVDLSARLLGRKLSLPLVISGMTGGHGRALAVNETLARVAERRGIAIGVGGVGGTSFAAVEAMRAAAQSDSARMSLGNRFRDWGVPTAVAVVGSSASGLPVIATGGVRSGLDAAKALALGASVVGVGRPLLQAALRGEDAVMRWVADFELELRTATFLSGGRRAADLSRAPIVVTGPSKEWLDQLGWRRRTPARTTD